MLKAKLVTVLVFCFTTTFSFGQGISVSPSRIFFQGKPGQTLSESIYFTNNSNTELSFVSSIKDWNRDSVGTKLYYPMDSLKESNASWLSLSENRLELKPGETKTVNVSLSVPEKGASHLSHSMLFFTQLKEQTRDITESGFGINVLVEVGIQVYHVPSGLAPGELEFLAFEDLGYAVVQNNSVRKVALKIRNTGAINKDAYVRFELTSMKTGKEIPIASTPIAILPKAEQWVHLNLPADLKGRYLAVAILDAGTQYDLKIAEKEITY